jgi:hypothetical protein
MHPRNNPCRSKFSPAGFAEKVESIQIPGALDSPPAFGEKESGATYGHHFQTGYHAWEISNLRPIAEPFPVQAERGIYRVEVESPDQDRIDPASD